jgi:hypothetical protein
MGRPGGPRPPSLKGPFFFPALLLLAGCGTGFRHVRLESPDCLYDITYPAVSNPRAARAVQSWIDGERAEFKSVPALRRGKGAPPKQFWTTCRIFHSPGTESVVLENDRYAGGAQEIRVKTFTDDPRTGRLLGLFDLLDGKRDWFGILCVPIPLSRIRNILKKR